MLARDPFMKRCIHDNEECDGRVEFEHALIYAGKQVVAWWSIVPVCTYHHRGKGLIKDFNQAVAFGRLYSEVNLSSGKSLTELADQLYPKNSWRIEYLIGKYENHLRKLKLV